MLTMKPMGTYIGTGQRSALYKHMCSNVQGAMVGYTRAVPRSMRAVWRVLNSVISKFFCRMACRKLRNTPIYEWADTCLYTCLYTCTEWADACLYKFLYKFWCTCLYAEGGDIC